MSLALSVSGLKSPPDITIFWICTAMQVSSGQLSEVYITVQRAVSPMLHPSPHLPRSSPWHAVRSSPRWYHVQLIYTP